MAKPWTRSAPTLGSYIIRLYQTHGFILCPSSACLSQVALQQSIIVLVVLCQLTSWHKANLLGQAWTSIIDFADPRTFKDVDPYSPWFRKPEIKSSICLCLSYTSWCFSHLPKPSWALSIPILGLPSRFTTVAGAESTLWQVWCTSPRIEINWLHPPRSMDGEDWHHQLCKYRWVYHVKNQKKWKSWVHFSRLHSAVQRKQEVCSNPLIHPVFCTSKVLLFFLRALTVFFRTWLCQLFNI